MSKTQKTYRVRYAKSITDFLLNLPKSDLVFLRDWYQYSVDMDAGFLEVGETRPASFDKFLATRKCVLSKTDFIAQIDLDCSYDIEMLQEALCRASRW